MSETPADRLRRVIRQQQEQLRAIKETSRRLAREDEIRESTTAVTGILSREETPNE